MVPIYRIVDVISLLSELNTAKIQKQFMLNNLDIIGASQLKYYKLHTNCVDYNKEVVIQIYSCFARIQSTGLDY